MKTGLVPDQSLEKQMSGCMAGFFHLFDGHHILTAKRLYTTKRLPPPTVVVDAQELHTSVESPPISQRPTPDPSETPPMLPLPLPLFQFKEGMRCSLKLCKEDPRLSLDSRATVDSRGTLQISSNRFEKLQDRAEYGDGDEQQRRSASVVARLMGLESLPNSSPEPVKNAELRRCASESRVSRDVFHCQFIDNNRNFQLNSLNSSNTRGTKISINVIRENATSTNTPVGPMEYSSRNAKTESSKISNRSGHGPAWKPPQHRKAFFDSADFFPEPKQTFPSIYGGIDEQMRFRGIDELATLKQFLDAIQLKGLLHHSQNPSESLQRRHRNDVYNEESSSPIVVMKPSRSPVLAINRRNIKLAGETSPLVNTRRQRPAIDRNLRGPTRVNESHAKRSNSLVNPKPVRVEAKRKVNESTQQRRVAPVPKLSDRTITNSSTRSQRSTAEIYRKDKITTLVTEDESSSISGSTSSQTYTARLKMEEYKGARSLLERSDKLLQSISEITAIDLQPSPVSVLDSEFYKDDSFSPSPVMKRSIDFTAEQCIELEDEIWIPVISSAQSKSEDKSNYCDFMYISDILRASNYLPEDTDIFSLLEKQQYMKGKGTSKLSRLQRKLIFDTVSEILDRNRQLPPWKVLSFTNFNKCLEKIWSEFQRMREREKGEEDYFEVICGILKRDIAVDTINGRGDCPVEMSEVVLDIERLIFKDLVGETIRDVATFAGKSKISVSRRKLVF